MRIVVFGGTGNLGTCLVDALAHEPEVDSVVSVARRNPPNQPAHVEFASADLAHDDLDSLVTGADVVVHLAWAIQPMHRPAMTWTTNVGGMHRLVEAVARTRVPALVYSSSIGAYAARDVRAVDERVDESWSTTGIGGVPYSMEKAYIERLLDVFEERSPWCRVVRVRPSLVMQHQAGNELTGLFAGPVALAIMRLARRSRLPLPLPADLRFQVVHSTDVASALVEACRRPVRGAFNLAADPVITRDEIVDAIGTTALPLPWPALRTGAAAGFVTRVSPLDPAWVDLVHMTPLIDATRAREELGWKPSHDAVTTLRATVEGVLQRAKGPTPPLQ